MVLTSALWCLAAGWQSEAVLVCAAEAKPHRDRGSLPPDWGQQIHRCVHLRAGHGPQDPL